MPHGARAQPTAPVGQSPGALQGNCTARATQSIPAGLHLAQPMRGAARLGRAGTIPRAARTAPALLRTRRARLAPPQPMRLPPSAGDCGLSAAVAAYRQRCARGAATLASVRSCWRFETRFSSESSCACGAWAARSGKIMRVCQLARMRLAEANSPGANRSCDAIHG